MKRKKTKHAYIPDTQITPSSKIDHIEAAGNFLAEKQPDKVIIAGDWWDMPSLCSYDKVGSHGWEDKSLHEDYEAGVRAMGVFLSALRKPKGYSPQVIITLGNHEHRIIRASEDPHNRKYAEYLTYDNLQLDKMGVCAYPYQEIVVIDGIMYSHVFSNPSSLYGNPVGGTIENKLKLLGYSFTMGHQQHKQYGCIYTALGTKRNGLVCGRFYQEEPAYLGPQKAKQSWSGIFVKHEVCDGDYDLMEVSMDYLLEEYI